MVIYLTSTMVLGTIIIYGAERPALHYPMVVIVSIIVATKPVSDPRVVARSSVTSPRIRIHCTRPCGT
ncbi:hypothetical protein QSJ19_14485 [Gordonia sp. ABSL11-1]|uniref:hypothetical protein n=1 Tax=Gordonia sp. ABSL11-1 TaxID=3053924 RepID=UPI0025723855|nr:hypothetical protein [Gordonia sp. ABSL11-1]MDL9946774.1 hypothetical protein [Gordonia sp. ABSL11-1]